MRRTNRTIPPYRENIMIPKNPSHSVIYMHSTEVQKLQLYML